MKDMRFDKVIPDNKKMSDRLNSYQFQLSQEIFGKRVSLNLSRSEAAKLTDLSLDKYTRIEQGIDLESNKEKYQQVLNKLCGFLKIEIKVPNSKTLQYKTAKEILKTKAQSKIQNRISSYQMKIRKSVPQLQEIKKK